MNNKPIVGLYRLNNIFKVSRSCHKLVCVKGTQRNEATISTVHKEGETFPQIQHLEQ